MVSTKPLHASYQQLIAEIESGDIKIPQFQREFVWDLRGSAKLIDSILKGYPIGAFIFWRTKDRLRSIRNIGDLNLPEPKEGEFVSYVLDGQQRITSIFATIKGAHIKRDGKHSTDYSKIFINLNASHDEPLTVINIENSEDRSFISIIDLLKFEFDFIKQYSPENIKKIEKTKAAISNYQFSVIEVKDAEIDIATEIFTRINVGGKTLTLNEIMVAKTYDVEKGFDLAEKYDDFMEELKGAKYDTIPAITVLQTLSMLLQGDCKRSDILTINKDKFIDMWEPTIDSIRSVIDYFRQHFRIPVSRLLPYNALIIPFAYYFHKQKTKPMGEIQKRLDDFFWRASLGVRYSSGVETKLVKDVEKVENIINGKPVNYEWTINTRPDFIKENGGFSTGRSYIKGILAIFASKEPLSFDDNSKVNIDNSWLKIATSRNYHHFFPTAFLIKNRPDLNKFYINHILNITLVDDYLNKVKIKAKAPSKYIKDFSNHNNGLKEALKTHLIGDPDQIGIVDDDYDKFISKRADALSKEMEKRVILTNKDNQTETLEEDSEEEVQES
jgi:hypothetical protein